MFDARKKRFNNSIWSIKTQYKIIKTATTRGYQARITQYRQLSFLY